MVKKIYAFWFYLILIFLLLLSSFGLVSAIIDKNTLLFVIFIFAVVIFISFISFKLHSITINFETKRLSFFAFGFANWKTIRLDQWNYDVYLPDVKDVEIVKLKKEERRKFLGSKYLFRKHLKIQISNDRYKYIYVSLFTKKQIKYIYEMLIDNGIKRKSNLR